MSWRFATACQNAELAIRAGAETETLAVLTSRFLACAREPERDPLSQARAVISAAARHDAARRSTPTGVILGAAPLHASLTSARSILSIDVALITVDDIAPARSSIARYSVYSMRFWGWHASDAAPVRRMVPHGCAALTIHRSKMLRLQHTSV
jgi:hypothetical protein